jgi:hypothetical protein
MKNKAFIQLIGISLFVIFTSISCDRGDKTQPLVYTLDVIETSSSKALITGVVTYDGGLPLSARGFVWGTNTKPTLSNSFSIDEIKSAGTYSHILSDLTPQTKYYVRAYATNSEGTAYGEVLSFTTEDFDWSLKTITILTQSQNTEVLETFSFSYNSDNLLSRTDWSSQGTSSYEVYEYNQEGKVIGIKSFLNNNEIGFATAEWIENQVKVTWYASTSKDEGAFWQLVHYIDENNRINRTESYLSDNNDWFLELYIINTFENENIVKQDIYEHTNQKSVDLRYKKMGLIHGLTSIKLKTQANQNHTTDNESKSDYELKYSYLTSYDNKINPFETHNALVLTSLSNPQILSKNNISHQVLTTFSPSGDNYQNFSYSYFYGVYDTPLELTTTNEGAYNPMVQIWNFSYNYF